MPFSSRRLGAERRTRGSQHTEAYGPCGGRRARLGPDQRSLGGQGGEEEGKGKGKEKQAVEALR